MEYKLPSYETILEIHEIVIDSYGGLSGIQHPQYIESALARPQNYMKYQKNCDIHLVAALLLNSIATYHAFSDGNKRTALISMIMAYRLNNINLEYDLHMNKKFERLVLKVADKKPSIQSTRRSLMRLIKEFEK